MKMQEMIGEFRTQMATLPKYAKEADEGFADVEKLLGDFERLEMLNVKYTQKLGPRTPKSKDLPGQMKLPIEGA